MDGGEWLAGTEALGVMVRELGTDGHNSLDATLCAQLCQGLSFTSEQMLVGHWNTSTATRTRTHTVAKTPPRCTHFLFAVMDAVAVVTIVFATHTEAEVVVTVVVADGLEVAVVVMTVAIHIGETSKVICIP